MFSLSAALRTQLVSVRMRTLFEGAGEGFHPNTNVIRKGN